LSEEVIYGVGVKKKM